MSMSVQQNRLDELARAMPMHLESRTRQYCAVAIEYCDVRPDHANAMCDPVIFVARPRHTDRRRLVLARDRVGVKPLYYAVADGRLLFASEIKAILEHPAATRDIDEAALYHYLTFLTTPAPMLTRMIWRLRSSEGGLGLSFRGWGA